MAHGCKIANLPTRVQALSEAEKTRELAHRDLQQKREQKARAKRDRERNEALAKAAKEKLENEWKPYIGAMKAGNYTKRNIPTFRQVQRYLKKEKKISKAEAETINASNALAKMKPFYS